MTRCPPLPSGSGVYCAEARIKQIKQTLSLKEAKYGCCGLTAVEQGSVMVQQHPLHHKPAAQGDGVSTEFSFTLSPHCSGLLMQSVGCRVGLPRPVIDSCSEVKSHSVSTAATAIPQLIHGMVNDQGKGLPCEPEPVCEGWNIWEHQHVFHCYLCKG